MHLKYVRNLDTVSTYNTLRPHCGTSSLAPSIKGFSLAVLQHTLSFPQHVGVIETGLASCKCANSSEGGLAEPRARRQTGHLTCLMEVNVKELLRK
jgi:hypothetical protein